MNEGSPSVRIALGPLANRSPFVLAIDRNLAVSWASRVFRDRLPDIVSKNILELMWPGEGSEKLTQEWLEEHADEMGPFSLKDDANEFPLMGQWLSTGEGYLFLGDPNAGSQEELNLFGFDDFGANDHLVELITVRAEAQIAMNEASLATNRLKAQNQELIDHRERQDHRAEELDGQRRAIMNMFMDMGETNEKLKETNAALEKEIIDRKQAEDSLRFNEKILRQAEETMEALLNATDEAALLIENDGTIVMANQKITERFDKTKDELIGQSIFENLAPEVAAARRERNRQVIDSYEPAMYEDERDGRWYHHTIYPVLDDDEVVMLGIFSRDITHHKQAEEKLKAVNAELDSFVRTASHDLRSPLVSLHGFLSLLRDMEGDKLSDMGRRYLDRIEANAERMEQLIEDLLALSRSGREMAPREVLDLNQLVDFIRTDFSPKIEAGATLIIPDELPVIHGERSAITQVFTNLISNAFKYMGDEPDPRVELEWTTEDELLHFTLIDNGIGIDPAYHDRIFESFQALKDERAGEVDASGLGLSIVKRITNRHGGKVWVESDGENGSKFHFTLSARMPGSTGSQEAS